MTLNRAQLRTKIRELIRDFYDTDTVATGGISSSSEELPVTNVARYNAGDLIVIESEHMIVRSIDSSVSPAIVSVTRGAQLSTPAAHLAAVAILIRPEFTDRALNQAIDSAIKDSYPGIWLEVVDETLSTSTTAREYTIPNGFTFVRRIQVANAEGYFFENKDWDLIGTKIQFGNSFGAGGLPIRVIGQTYQSLLVDDSTNLTLSDEQADFIIYKGALLTLEMRLGPRLKATEYSASVNDRAGQPLELLQMFRYLVNETERIKLRETKTQMGGYTMKMRR